MKKFSFKKITAAVSAAAMIATLGTTAFADTVGNVGTGVEINTITKTLVDETNEIYNIKVDFTSSSSNEIGMTMLTYGNSDDSDLTLNTNWSDNSYKSDSMKIIGVDQISPVTDGNTGSFEFKITTKQAAGAIYLKKGKTALIALSGDGVTTPAVAPLSINATAGYAETVTLGEVQIAANADVSAKLTEAAKKQTVAIYEKQGDSESLGNVSLENAEFPTSWTESDGTYTATATIPSDTVMSGVDFPSAGLSVSLSARVKFSAVKATKATAVEGFTASTTSTEFTKTFTVDDTISNADAALKAEVVGKTVTLTDETGKVSGTVGITEGMVVTSDTYNSSNQEDQVITYTVTVPEGETSNKLLNVPNVGISVTVKVTATKTPVIKDITLSGDDIEVTVTKGDDDDATKAAIKSALDAKIASGYKFVVDNADVAIANATYEWIVSGSGNTFTATMKATEISADEVAEMPDGGIAVTLPEITITVNDKPAVVYGDLTGDGKVMANDVAQAFLASKGKKTLSAEQLLAADVATKNPDGRVMANDVAQIFLKSKNKIDKFPVEN